MPEGSIIAMVMGLTVTAVVVIGFVVAFVTIFKKAQQQKTQQEYAEKYRARNEAEKAAAKPKQNSSTAQQQKKLDAVRDRYKEQRDRHQLDADKHEHLGEEEHYDDIVGSLGEVNDEGCEDLSGVRFIAHDMAYEINDEHADYSKVAQAMVLGEILNNPRFQKPYTRK